MPIHKIRHKLVHVVKRTFFFIQATFSGDVAAFCVRSTADTFFVDVATFSLGSVSATLSGTATLLGMRFPKNVATYKSGYIYW